MLIKYCLFMLYLIKKSLEYLINMYCVKFITSLQFVKRGNFK